MRRWKHGGDRNISRIAKAKDFTKNNHIKDEQRVVLRDLDRIMGRWKGYFDKAAEWRESQVCECVWEKKGLTCFQYDGKCRGDRG